MSKQVTTQDLWAGTDESLVLFADIQAKIEARISLGGEAPQEESLLAVSGNVGVVSIKGPISNNDSAWNRFFGATSYPAINKALIEAATNPNVQRVIIDLDTPGGAVSGVVDTADLISRINKQVKPIEAFAGNGALSAGYWLASAAGKVYASKTASIGSVGIIMTHVERSAQLKEDGVAVTVLRAGKYKALASSVEPLTEDARAQIQETLDGAYAVFAEHVASARGMSMPVFEATAGQGRVFLGAKAQDVGLVDGIKSFTEVFNAATKAAPPKNAVRAEASPILQGETTMSVALLTEQALAAIAAGAQVHTQEAVQAAAAIDPVVEAVAAEEGIGGATTEAAAAAAVAAPVVAQTGVDVLQAQLVAKDAQILTAHVQINGLQAQVDQFKEAQAPLLAILGKSISNMQVALGGTAFNMEGRSAADMLAEHGRLSDTFSNKFKAGGVSATAAVETLKEAPKAADSLHKARIAATQPNR